MQEVVWIPDSNKHALWRNASRNQPTFANKILKLNHPEYKVCGTLGASQHT